MAENRVASEALEIAITYGESNARVASEAVEVAYTSLLPIVYALMASEAVEVALLAGVSASGLRAKAYVID